MFQIKSTFKSLLDPHVLRAAKSFASEGDLASAVAVLSDSIVELSKVTTLSKRDQRLIDSVEKRAAKNAFFQALNSSEIAASSGDESRALFDIERFCEAAKHLKREITELEHVRIERIKATASSCALEVLITEYEKVANEGSPNEGEHFFSPLEELASRTPLSAEQYQRIKAAFEKAKQRALELWGVPATDQAFDSLRLVQKENL